MALPAYVGAGSGVAITTGSSSVSKTTCVAGNLLVCHYLVRGATDDVTRSNPSNITNLIGGSGVQPIVVNRDVGGAGGSKHGFYAGRVTANGTCSTDFTVGASGNDIFVRMYEFSGAFSGSADDGIGLFENQGSVVQSNAGTATSLTDRLVETAGPDRLAISLVSVAANQALGSFTGETGGDWTEIPDGEFASGTGATGTIQVQTAAMASAGTIDGGSMTITSADWGVISFGIIPSVIGGAADNPPIGFLGRGAGW